MADQNDPPVRTPITGDAVMSPAWVRYFMALGAQIREALSNTGGAVTPYRLQYRIDDPAAVKAAGRLAPLDWTQYDEIVIDLLVDRDLGLLSDPLFLGTIDQRKGKKLCVMLTFSDPTSSVGFFGLNLNAPAMANQQVSDTGHFQTRRATLEWRFKEDGTGHLCNLTQLA